MPSKTADVHRTLEYRGDQWIMTCLPIALVLGLMGLVSLAFVGRELLLPGWILLTAGIAGTGFILYRRFNPGRPLLVLSPTGISFRIGSSKEILIPWYEVRGVDTIDFKVWSWTSRIPLRVKFQDTTAVLVTKRFYDSRIFIPSAFMRGPGWDSLFRPKGEMMQIALHHEQFGVSPEEVREPIEARWRAFSGRAEESASAEPRTVATAGALPMRVKMPERGTAIVTSPWDAAKIFVPAAGIVVVLANLMGLWQTAAQQEDRLVRQQEEQEARREAEERRQREEKWDKFWKDVNRDFKTY